MNSTLSNRIAVYPGTFDPVHFGHVDVIDRGRRIFDRLIVGIGTNPEELIAAAHAGCFSMALSLILGNAGMTAESIDTKATLTMEKTDAGFTITAVHLDVSVKIPGGDQAKFDQAAQNAKKGCPVSRVLNANITMDAKLIA